MLNCMEEVSGGVMAPSKVKESINGYSDKRKIKD